MKKISIILAMLTVVFCSVAQADITTNTGVPFPAPYQKQNDCGYCQPAQSYSKELRAEKKSVTPKKAKTDVLASSKKVTRVSKPQRKAS
ncbi:hypothetical protein H7F10_00770 [Acidithiobacillus sp. HP-6]|uniref:hypothetical protein n=1 Tax=unclassified Acidithiobacillus TaxID=2614800 RepID=UPI001879EC4F|nr:MULTISPECIES: hypothetical protein [unclassified Acidithiobacillus]MBE7561520.1 hypothetical protein [Acidithiobacillus sp. HP-6]MBE7570309.1 hypothetical protein [Acidithiobacillus sp. HP-2]